MQRVNFIAKRDVIIIAAAILSVLFYILTTHSIVGNAGFPLDDSWIHQTYGRNLAATGRWEYVPGVPSAGSTSPLYTVLLALGYFLHIPYFLWTYGLGALFLSLTGIIGARLADQVMLQMRDASQLTPSQNKLLTSAGLWSGLALVTAWHLIWAAASGMETILFCALSLLLIYILWREVNTNTKNSKRILKGFIFGITGAALIASRPEGIVLVGLLVLLVLLTVVTRPQDSWQALELWLSGSLIGGALGIAPYLLLNLSLNGQLVPNTFSAKQAENVWLLQQPFVVNLWAMVQPLTAGGQLFLVPGIVAATVQLIRRSKLSLYLILLLWSLTIILLYTLRLPAYYQHGRYVIPALPTLIILGVCGTLHLIQITQRRKTAWARILTRTLSISAILLFAVFWWNGAGYFAQDVSMIESDMVAAAKWLAANVPNDQLLAVHDIGAVGYFAPRPMLDLAGLVSPEVVPIILNRTALMELIQARQARYLMVLPSQLGQVADADDKRLCERFNARGGMGGMIIYELVWDGKCI